MRSVFFPSGAGPPRSVGGGVIWLAFVTQVGKAAGHQLVSRADLPTQSHLVGYSTIT